ncbi:MAG TPA: hypothetical protein VF074_14585 [Pyrinomonadaceae bacterium]
MRSLLKFFSLTYLASWILWIVSAAILRGTLAQSSGLRTISGFLYLLGVFAPSLVALALTHRAEGRTGTLALLNRTVPRLHVGGASISTYSTPLKNICRDHQLHVGDASISAYSTPF